MSELNGEHVRLMSLNGLAYIYGKLSAKVDSYNDSSKNDIETFKTEVKSDVDSATALASAKANAAQAATDSLENFMYGVNSDFVTKSDMQSQFSQIANISMVVVDSLPGVGETGRIYLMLDSDNPEDYVYDEYVWVADTSTFKKVGSTRINLSPYLTSEEIGSKYASKAEVAAAYIPRAEASAIFPTIEDADNKYATKASLYNDYVTKSDATAAYVQKSIYNDMIQSLITADADNLTAAKQDAKANYLQKSVASEVYATKEELSSLESAVGNITSFEAQIVTELPAEGVKGVIYMIAATDAADSDSYDEYLWIPDTSTFEKVGSTRLDLTPYAKSADVASTYLSKTDAASNYLGKTATAAAATKLATARTITLSNAVTGSVSFDGSANVTITTSVKKGTSAPSSLADGSVYFVYE